MEALAAAPPDVQMKAFQRSLHSQVHVNLRGRYSASGSGVVDIGFVPDSNAADGQTSVTSEVSITGPLRKPLKSRELNECAGELRAMEEARQIFALLVLNQDREGAAKSALRLFEEWHSIIAPFGTDKYEVVSTAPNTRPKTRRLAAKSFPKSKLWQSLLNELCQLDSLSCSLASRFAPEDDDFGPPASMTHNHGFALMMDAVWLQRSAEEAAPQIGLWLTSDGLDAEAALEAKTKLVNLIRGAEGSIYQAHVGSWSWIPSYFDSTPYERACGIHGQCTTSRRWSSRFLRAVTESMWLGPELKSRVKSLPALEDLGLAKALLNATEISATPERFKELEDTLEVLLPDQTDWKAGVDKLYGR